MIIQCTKKVLDALNIDASQLESPEGFDQYPESLFGWHANIITISRKKVLVLMNNETRFPVVITRFLRTFGERTSFSLTKTNDGYFNALWNR